MNATETTHENFEGVQVTAKGATAAAMEISGIELVNIVIVFIKV